MQSCSVTVSHLTVTLWTRHGLGAALELSMRESPWPGVAIEMRLKADLELLGEEAGCLGLE